MSDEIIWGIINHQFCAFKLSTSQGKGTGKGKGGQTFCRNEMNVTGLCNRQSCPLANSRYATVREAQGRIYLYIKTPERAHMPSKLWEKRRLPANYQGALKMIDDCLIYSAPFLVHKAKQRLTRLTQVAIRSRRLAKEEARLGEKVVPKLAPKIRRREETRERKAEAAAKLERTVERELLERLRQGAYGDQPLNVSETVWKKVLKGLEREGEVERDQDMDKESDQEDEDEDELEYELEEEEDENGSVEYVSDLDDSDDDLEDIEDWLGSEDSDQDEDESASEESDDEPTKKKPVAGDKRKKGQASRKPKVARREREMEKETQYEGPARQLAW